MDTEYEYCERCDKVSKVIRHYTVNPADPTDAVKLKCGHTEVPFNRMFDDEWQAAREEAFNPDRSEEAERKHFGHDHYLI